MRLGDSWLRRSVSLFEKWYDWLGFRVYAQSKEPFKMLFWGVERWCLHSFRIQQGNLQNLRKITFELVCCFCSFWSREGYFRGFILEINFVRRPYININGVTKDRSVLPWHFFRIVLEKAVIINGRYNGTQFIWLRVEHLWVSFCSSETLSFSKDAFMSVSKWGFSM